MNKLPQLLIAMTLLGVSVAQAEQSGFITPEQSAALNKKQVATPSLKTPTVATTAAVTATPLVGYLGIGFDKVPTSIRAHLPNNVTAQQGLIITRFADKSSAADDGLKVYDILLNYDGQAIEKPENFIQKIRNDKPGRIVKFTLVRQGEVLTIPVTMGAQKNKKTIIKTRQRQNSYQQTTAGKAPPNANFNGLAIRKLGNDIYEASIGIIGADGKAQRRSYKGNRMQILQQIMQDRSLPPQAKQQLLFAVKPKQQSSSWGGMPNMPFGNGNWGGMPKMPFGNNNGNGNGFNPSQFFRGW